MNLRPLHHRVIVKRLENETKNRFWHRPARQRRRKARSR